LGLGSGSGSGLGLGILSYQILSHRMSRGAAGDELGHISASVDRRCDGSHLRKVVGG
jgi:hypothetical protein